MTIGTVVLPKYFNGVAPADLAAKYQKNLIENFSEVGMFAFGQMPFIAKGPDPEKDYDWKNIDALVDFGGKNNIAVQYNAVINSHANSFPEWYKPLTPKEKRSALERHIKAVIGRYKGKIKTFKLVNEAFRYDELDFLGTAENRSTLIASLFRTAKETYPEGAFMLNDHIPFLDKDELRDRYVALIKGVLAAGGPVDVIGIEGHLDYRPKTHELPPDEFIHKTLDKIHQVSNLPIHITEFDLSYDNAPAKPYPGSLIDPTQPFISDAGEFKNWFDYQAYAYRHFRELCETKGYVKDLIYWGFYDGDYHVSHERPGIGFFDQDFIPKPTLAAIKA